MSKLIKRIYIPVAWLQPLVMIPSSNLKPPATYSKKYLDMHTIGSSSRYIVHRRSRREGRTAILRWRGTGL